MQCLMCLNEKDTLRSWEGGEGCKGHEGVWSQLERKLEEKQGKEAKSRPPAALLSWPQPHSQCLLCPVALSCASSVHRWLHTWQETVGVSRLDLQSGPRFSSVGFSISIRIPPFLLSSSPQQNVHELGLTSAGTP